LEIAMLRIGIAGINGRMGREIVAAADGMDDVAIVGGFAGPGRAMRRGADDQCSPEEPLSAIDVLIDFSTPSGVEKHAHTAAEAPVPYVCGVTGLNDEQMTALRHAAAATPVFYARNMSLGIAAVLSMLPEFAGTLNDYDAEIVEMHHRRKADAPSGTALALAEAIAEGRDVDLTGAAVHGRSGHAPRAAGEIGIHAVRGGGNAGEHTIIFASDGEEIRIQHRALSRRTFADGAIQAARFIVSQAPGFYGMADLVQHALT
jgi:4-hydroxy-tetrahydrodipicolinate reductase